MTEELTRAADDAVVARLGELDATDDGTSPEDRPPIALTEAALEALLFVAERPLSRREIAALAGTDRETVDARLGDLEVSLQERGIRLLHFEHAELLIDPTTIPTGVRRPSGKGRQIRAAASSSVSGDGSVKRRTKLSSECITGMGRPAASSASAGNARWPSSTWAACGTGASTSYAC